MKKILSVTLALASLAFVSVSSQAAPVQWTLNGWNLDDDVGEVTGSFVFDVDLGTFSNVNISSTLGPESYSWAGLGADANTLEFVTGDPNGELSGTSVMLAAIGGGGMTNAGGGPLSVLTQGGTNPLSSQSTCDNADCSTVSNPVYLTFGNITGTSVVPIPAAAWLFGSAMLGLVGVARRKKAQRI
jgi:hypothetical protein